MNIPNLKDGFVLDVGEIVESNPHLNYYIIRPLVHSYALEENYTCTPIGNITSYDSGVQVTFSYLVGEQVIFFKPGLDNHLSNVGFILARVGFYSNESKARPQYQNTEGLNYFTAPIYNDVNATNQYTTTLFNYIGTGLLDSWAGDYTITGKNTSVRVSDEVIRVKAGNSQIAMNNIDRRLEVNSTLATTTTISSVKDLSLVGREVLDIEKYSFSTLGSYGGYTEDEEGNITLEDSSWEPSYNYEVTKGYIYKGVNRTMYDTTNTIPLASSRITDKGSLSLEGTKGVSLSKKPSISSLRYIGERLEGSIDIQDTFEEQKEVDTSLWDQTDTLSEETLALLENTPSLQLGENSLLADFEDVEINDNGETVNAAKADVKILDDGSIKLKDAWGSYILLSKGNVEIYSTGNTFLVAGRDRIDITNGLQAIKATKGLQVEATAGDISIGTSQGLRTSSEELSLSATTTDIIGNTKLLMKGKDVILSGKALKKANSSEVGSITLNTDGTIVEESTNLLAYVSNDITLCNTNSKGIVVSKTEGTNVFGNLTVGGSTKLRDNSYSFTYKSISKESTVSLATSSSARTLIIDGETRTSGSFVSLGNIYVDGTIASTTLACEGGELRSCSGLTDTINSTTTDDFSKDSSDVTLNIYATSDLDLDSQTDESISERLFSYANPSTICTYLLDYEDLEANETLENFFKVEQIFDIVGNAFYIYPGNNFWSSKGLQISQEDGSTINKGFKNLKSN